MIRKIKYTIVEQLLLCDVAGYQTPKDNPTIFLALSSFLELDLLTTGLGLGSQEVLSLNG